MKKLSTALCLSSTLLASASVQAGWQCNWLLGASGGYYDRHGELHVTVINPLSSQSVITREFNDIGWLAGLFTGYQIQCNRWLSGAELKVDWYDNDNNDHDLAFTGSDSTGWIARTEYEREWVVGLTGRLGFEISPCLLPYVRLGVEWNHDKLHFNPVVSAPPIFTAGGNFEGREDSFNMIVGLGVEMPMPRLNCFTVRLEYDFHAKAERIEAPGVISAIGAPGTGLFSIDASRKPYTQTGIVSVVWNI